MVSKPRAPRDHGAQAVRCLFTLVATRFHIAQCVVGIPHPHRSVCSRALIVFPGLGARAGYRINVSYATTDGKLDLS